MAGILGILGMCLLLGGVHVTSGVTTVDIPEKVYKIARGENVTIPCLIKLSPGGSAPIISWTATPDMAGEPVINVATYFNPTTTKVYKRYKGRATLIYDIAKGKADLHIMGVLSTDTRVYECKVQLQEEDEDSPSDTTNLVVLVAPSTPICNIVGTKEYFQDITMTCKSEEGTPTPTYKWQSYDISNIPRPNPPKATDQNGVLSLYNISKETSGYFVCTSSNEIRSAKCNLTLAVMPPSMNLGSTAGIIGAIAGLVLLLGIIILIYCCCRKRREKSEEYVMGTPDGGEFTDKDPEENDPEILRDERINYEEERRVKSADRHDTQDNRSERSYDRRSDYDDRRDHYADRREDPGDRRERYSRDDRYDDRYDDRRDRRDHYDDQRDRYDDRRDRYDDRRDRYNDRSDRYDDRYDSDRYSERYDSRDRPPSVPPNKPKEPRT